MPRTTVYIRNEDWPEWQALGNKSAFISDALNDMKPQKPKSFPPLPGQLEIDAFTGAVCKTHGLPVVRNGKCLQKGCKG